MNDILKVDFEKIIAQVKQDIDRANEGTLKKHPSSDIDKINQTAKIAEAVCISALRAYHEELCQQLSSLIQPNNQ